MACRVHAITLARVHVFTRTTFAWAVETVEATRKRCSITKVFTDDAHHDITRNAFRVKVEIQITLAGLRIKCGSDTLATLIDLNEVERIP